MLGRCFPTNGLSGGAANSPHPPLTVFLDRTYGEYLHSDAEKAHRIKEVDGGHGLYEWQFHWVAERLAILFSGFLSRSSGA